eukprot:768584-Hanusia_phi.AAC.3
MSSELERLLDFSSPLDVALLDQVVIAMYTCRDETQRKQINAFMTAFQEHPQAWTRVDTILERTQCDQSRFFALATLETCVKQRWKVQGVGMHCNIVESGKTNETLCGNNMQILKLLSEEVFEFSLKQLTSKKIDDLKERLTQELSDRFPCQTTLQCFLRFLFWVPLYYVFETPLIEMLLHKVIYISSLSCSLLTLRLQFFPQPQFRSDALQCLTEIAVIEPKGIDPRYHPKIQKTYADFITNLSNIVQPNAIKQYYEEGESGEEFVQRLTLFLCTILKTHIGILETQELVPYLIQGLQYLVFISEVDDDEIFKICTEYWNFLADDLYHKEVLLQRMPIPTFCQLMPNQNPRLQTYAPILTEVRRILIERMPKPEEVLVVEDENGQVVKEHLKDVEVVALHKTVRETLVYLTHLDHQQTEEIMIEKLGLQVHPAPGGPGWSRQGLSTLCWAIGSISGAMREDDEKKFLVHVIKDLLGLCEIVRGKDNKAVIASNIMYVVGQYPRFLRAHWKFLKTVVNKLFEFMHETHPGVQDMACETFLKICQRCKQQFVKHQPQEPAPFIDQLLIGPHSTVADIGSTIADLEAHQINMFYEAVGYIVAAELTPERRDQIVQVLFKIPNQRWTQIIGSAMQDPNLLQQQETMREIAKILQINVRVSSSLGNPYIIQLEYIFERMLQVYKMYSEQISSAVVGNPLSAKTSGVRLMRAVKRETLRLIETTVEKSEEMQRIVAHFVPPLVDYVLADYQSNHPETRDPEVLSVFAAIIRRAGDSITDQVPRVLGAVFECTLAMITTNMEDYPEHRINFFNLLKEINHHCFRAFFQVPGEVFKVLIDSIVWAIKHRERNIAETGLTILLEMLRNLDGLQDIAAQFYAQFLINLLHEIFTVLTDKEHEPGFKLQCAILQHMIYRVIAGVPNTPLFNPSEYPGVSDNKSFVKQKLLSMLSEGFSDRMTQKQLNEFVENLFGPEKGRFCSIGGNHLTQYSCDQWTDSSLALQLEQEQKEAERKRVEEARMQNVPGLMPVMQREEVDMCVFDV